MDKGSYDDARALDTKALALLEHAGSDEAIDALNELGIVNDYQGRREEARAYYRRALNRYDQILGPDSRKASKVLTNLGLLEGDEGHTDEAIRDLSRALAIVEKTRGPDHPDTAETLANLAMVMICTGHEAEGLPLALRAVAIAEKAYGPDALDVAVALGTLSMGYNNLGRYGEAIPIAERELAIRLREGTPINIADAKTNLGTALFKSGRDKARARVLLTQAREGFLAVGRMNRLADIAEMIGTKPGEVTLPPRGEESGDFDSVRRGRSERFACPLFCGRSIDPGEPIPGKDRVNERRVGDGAQPRARQDAVVREILSGQ